MSMNKVKPGSDMYQFLNDYPYKGANRGHTWNTVKGRCEYNCTYCYMRRFKLNKRRFDESELKTDLGEGNFIFVGSSNDMFSHSVPSEDIERTFAHCRKFDNNKYLFQSKNPLRFEDFADSFPAHFVLGTTIETIEPIMDFDLGILVGWMKQIQPQWISIGADSKGHNLPEPSSEKVLDLITALKQDFKVILKKNLKRLLGRWRN